MSKVYRTARGSGYNSKQFMVSILNKKKIEKFNILVGAVVKVFQ